MSETAPARERAVAFVAAHGSDLDRLRAEALLGKRPASEVAESLAADGPAQDLARARFLLGALDDLRALREPVAETTCAWLAGQQSEDGSFGDTRDEAERIVATGHVAGFLAKSPWARPETLDAAGDHLAATFSPDRVQGFAWDAIAAYAHYFANALHDESDAVLQWCGRELERGFRARRFDAVRTARVLVWCDADGLPGAKLARADLVEALLSEQQPDGGWVVLDEPSIPSRILHTLDALAALARMG